MKYVLILILFSYSFAYDDQVLDPTFIFIFETDSIIIGQDSVGSFEGILYNNSINDISIGVVRTIDFVSENWFSSICIDAVCYNQSIDSISVLIAAGDSTICGVFASTNGVGSDEIQLKLFELSDQNNSMLVDINFAVQYEVSIDNENLHANSIEIISCYPNPFNSYITLSYKIEKKDYVYLGIYNLLGEKVRSLVANIKEPGYHFVKWNGKNGLNKDVSSGPYFLVLEIGGTYLIKNITFIK